MAETEPDQGLRERVTRQGEEAIGKLAQDLLDSPLTKGALSAASGTRERAVRAQAAALGDLYLPSASDLERLTRRLRSVSQRIVALEDGIDRLEQRVQALASGGLEQRLTAIEDSLGRIEGSGSAGGRSRLRGVRHRSLIAQSANEACSLSQAPPAGPSRARRATSPSMCSPSLRASSPILMRVGSSECQRRAGVRPPGAERRSARANSVAVSISTASAPRLSQRSVSPGGLS